MSNHNPTSHRGKIFVLSAPSGTGKSSIISKIIDRPELRLRFSISAEFSERAGRGEFVEWEEVYPGTCYGTLVSEIDRICDSGHNVIMDIDVKGALNVKKRFGDRAMTIFILPPSKEELERRLRGRATDSEETIAKRLAKADFELGFAPEFDHRVVNDTLEHAAEEVADLIAGA